MQETTRKPRYCVRFVRGGTPLEFEVTDEAMTEARACCHVAHHLRIPVNDLQGFQKGYQAIRQSVEGHNVHDVAFAQINGDEES